MDVVLTQCESLFQLELKGSTILIPCFIKAIIQVFSHGKKGPLPGNFGEISLKFLKVL